jgi:hypothetical protein
VTKFDLKNVFFAVVIMVLCGCETWRYEHPEDNIFNPNLFCRQKNEGYSVKIDKEHLNEVWDIDKVKNKSKFKIIIRPFELKESLINEFNLRQQLPRTTLFLNQALIDSEICAESTVDEASRNADFIISGTVSVKRYENKIYDHWYYMPINLVSFGFMSPWMRKYEYEFNLNIFNVANKNKQLKTIKKIVSFPKITYWSGAVVSDFDKTTALSKALNDVLSEIADALSIEISN